jgi:hypothetical protein
MFSRNIIKSTHFEPQQFGNDWGLFVDIENYPHNNEVVSNVSSKKTIKNNYKNLYIDSDVYEKCYINNFACIDFYTNDIESQIHSNNIFDYLNDKNNVYEIAGCFTTTIITSFLTYGLLCIL